MAPALFWMLLGDSSPRALRASILPSSSYLMPPAPAAGQGRLQGGQHWEMAGNQVDRLIICVFLEKDENIYRQRLPYFFPVGKYPVVRPWPAPAPPPSTLDRFSLSSAFQPDGTPPPTLTRTGKQGLALCVAAH
ncbi:hypothetical protein CB1_000297012 [Camelus ferus]|nr:hypothetical protein CB1_000297012 [Camelus ferus]